MSILDHPLISERYFYPRAARFPEAFIVEVDGAALACHRRDDHPGAKTLVHFHGNGEIVPDYFGDYADAVSALGLNALFVEYRGYGGSTGAPALGRMLGDVRAVVEALGQPPHELIAYGRSLGSIYAIELAHRFPDLAGLVIESGIATPLDRLMLRVSPKELGTTMDKLAAAAKKHIDHQAKLGGYRGPLLVLHAEDDDLIEVSHARRNHAWGGAAAADKTLRLFAEGGHNEIMSANWPAYWEALRGFVAQIAAREAR